MKHWEVKMAVKIQEHNSLVSKKFTNISFYRYVICTINTEFPFNSRYEHLCVNLAVALCHVEEKKKKKKTLRKL